MIISIEQPGLLAGDTHDVRTSLKDNNPSFTRIPFNKETPKQLPASTFPEIIVPAILSPQSMIMGPLHTLTNLSSFSFADRDREETLSPRLSQTSAASIVVVTDRQPGIPYTPGDDDIHGTVYLSLRTSKHSSSDATTKSKGGGHDTIHPSTLANCTLLLEIIGEEYGVVTDPETIADCVCKSRESICHTVTTLCSTFSNYSDNEHDGVLTSLPFPFVANLPTDLPSSLSGNRRESKCRLSYHIQARLLVRFPPQEDASNQGLFDGERELAVARREFRVSMCGNEARRRLLGNPVLVCPPDSGPAEFCCGMNTNGGMGNDGGIGVMINKRLFSRGDEIEISVTCVRNEEAKGGKGGNTGAELESVIIQIRERLCWSAEGRSDYILETIAERILDPTMIQKEPGDDDPHVHSRKIKFRPIVMKVPQNSRDSYDGWIIKVLHDIRVSTIVTPFASCVGITGSETTVPIRVEPNPPPRARLNRAESNISSPHVHHPIFSADTIIKDMERGKLDLPAQIAVIQVQNEDSLLLRKASTRVHDNRTPIPTGRSNHHYNNNNNNHSSPRNRYEQLKNVAQHVNRTAVVPLQGAENPSNTNANTKPMTRPTPNKDSSIELLSTSKQKLMKAFKSCYGHDP
mmetsp:Transcript_36888/g.42923  ORF Transcript_36888/g.42923 Transcript_36888/m.42923 type:complete len:632 (+) Transcript_36888:276-2171(+)